MGAKLRDAHHRALEAEGTTGASEERMGLASSSVASRRFSPFAGSGDRACRTSIHAVGLIAIIIVAEREAVMQNVARIRAPLTALALAFAGFAWGAPPPDGGACTRPTPLPVPLRSISIDTNTDYCSALKAAQPGDEFVFAAGVYNQPCHFGIQGTAENPIVIRSAGREPSQRAQFAYSEAQYKTKPSNFFEVQGQYIVIKDLYFTNNTADIVIRFFSGHHITIENNIFDGLAGQAITANSAATQNISIRNNTIRNIGQTAIYVGHAEGAYAATDFLLEGNYIDASSIHDPSITGYAAQVKLNSYGAIRDNSFFNAQGPNLMVYGNQDPNAPPNIIDGNYLERSRKGASLNIGGGPARVINNVIINQDRPAIFAENFHRRNLQRGITIAGNTLVNQNDAAVSVEAWKAGQKNIIAGNALYAKISFRPSPLTATVFDNITCGVKNCFSGSPKTSPYNFLLSERGLLAPPLKGNPVYPKYDFLGIPRTVNRAGAFSGGEGTTSSSWLTYLQPRPPRLRHCASN
jgi:hypothetical protein